METWHIILAITAGFFAGVINTLAGSGSLFTLPVLLFLGLPAHVANGTNRVGILTQTFVGALHFIKVATIGLEKMCTTLFLLFLDPISGALIATWIDEGILRLVIGIVMLLLLVVIAMNYSSLLREIDEAVSETKKFWSYPLLFVIGAYGGFISVRSWCIYTGSTFTGVKFYFSTWKCIEKFDELSGLHLPCIYNFRL